jgi:hypothetical protein
MSGAKLELVPPPAPTLPANTGKKPVPQRGKRDLERGKGGSHLVVHKKMRRDEELPTTTKNVIFCLIIVGKYLKRRSQFN